MRLFSELETWKRQCRKIFCFVTYYIALFNLWIRYMNYFFKNKIISYNNEKYIHLGS